MSIEQSWIHHVTSHSETYNYKCGHCGTETSGRVVSFYTNRGGIVMVKFLLCTSCAKGSVWLRPDIIIPGAVPGDRLEGLPDLIDGAYEEVRKCLSINAHTACELLCRKILMHIAVDKGAKEGETFEFYLDYLEKKGYITPTIKSWANLIRTHGNVSNHKIEEPEKERAEATFAFTVQLLRIIYEMDHKAKKYSQSSESKKPEK